MPAPHSNPQPPTLEAFGLTHARVAASRDIVHKGDNRWSILVVGIGSAFVALFFVVFATTSADGIGEAVAGTACCGFPLAVVAAAGLGLALPRFMHLIDSAYDEARDAMERFDQFNRAVKAFEREQRRRQREYWSNLSAVEFESEVAEIFRYLGFTSRITPRSGDKGIDIHLSDDTSRGIAQCKQYGKKATPAVARELYGALLDDGAEIAILICTGGFTSGVREFVKEKPIYLIDLDDLLRLREIAGTVPLNPDEFSFAELFIAMKSGARGATGGLPTRAERGTALFPE